MTEAEAEFDRHIARIHGLEASDTGELASMDDYTDIRHEEFQALVSAFLGDAYDQEKVRAVEQLQVDLQTQQMELYHKLSTNELTPETYVDKLNRVADECFSKCEAILGKQDFEILFGMPREARPPLVDKDEFLRSLQTGISAIETSGGVAKPGSQTDFDELNAILQAFLFADRTADPSFDSIAELLTSFGERLENDPERRKVFRRLLSEAVTAYPSRSTWAIDLIHAADKYRWSPWQVECLPTLFIHVRRNSQGDEHVLIWHYIAACVPSAHLFLNGPSLCQGQILQARVAAPATEFLEIVAKDIEAARLRNPFESERAMAGVIAGALANSEVILQNRSTADERDAIVRARAAILEESGILVKPKTQAIRKSLIKIAASLEFEADRDAALTDLAEAAKRIYPEVDLRKGAAVDHADEWIKRVLDSVA